MKIRDIQIGYGSTDAAVLEMLRTKVPSMQPLSEDVSSSVIASESISDHHRSQLETYTGNMESMFQTIRNTVLAKESGSFSNSVTAVAVAEQAATTAMTMLNAPRMVNTKRASTRISADAVSGDFSAAFVLSAESVDHYAGRRHPNVIKALEAFDQREQRNASLYTMAYNYIVSRQDEFGETIWPTLTLPADQIGFGIIVNRLTVHRGWIHKVDGSRVDMGKIDIVRAAVDHTILSNKKTRCYPIHRASSAGKFVDAAVIAPATVTVEGVTFTTSPLATGVTIDLLGLCQTDAMLAGGNRNQSDTLDPAVSLEAVYIKLGDDVVKLNVYQRQGANFLPSQQGLNEKRRLSFDSGHLNLNKASKRVDSSAFTEPALIKLSTDDLAVVFNPVMNGDLNTESGNMTVYGNSIQLLSVKKKVDGKYVKLDEGDADYQALSDLFADATIIGYDVRAWLTNVNMRERGDFIDRSQFIQLYEVPLLSPITAQRPIGTSGENDSSDFETLVTATRFRMVTDCVTALLEAVDRIREFCAVPIENEHAPEGLGASRFHIIPTYLEATGAAAIDCATIVSSSNTHEKIKNVQAALVDKLRNMAFAMFVNSEYQAAQMALGQMNPPTLVIGTDPIISRYMLVDGDLRTLTDKFNVKIVSTLDSRMRGKFFMTFITEDENRNSAPNILNWGNLVWGSEVVVSAPMPRGESITVETIVQPRYLYVNHLAVCAWGEVKNLDQVFDSTYLRYKTA